jgi:hypothetical protein
LEREREEKEGQGYARKTLHMTKGERRRDERKTRLELDTAGYIFPALLLA